MRKETSPKHGAKTLAVCLLCLVLVLSFGACGSGSSDSGSAGTKERYGFTSRDADASYDESTATLITLQDGASTVDGEGAQAEGDTVTITDEGTYILSGTLTDGQIVVETDDDQAKVQLVLNGVTVTNDTSAALYVKQADKVFVTLAEGTANNLTVTGTMEADGDTNVDGAVFSKDDITFNGDGYLTVTCSQGNGITSKDDLVVMSGTYTIDAAGHGLEGKDCVKVAGGTYNITCAKDGIHSSNTDDETLGYVYIAGGAFTMNAGDDGIHADNDLYIADGAINLVTCYEGLEGHTIDITGGTIDITSTDDALNAAGGSDQSGTTGGDTFAMNEENDVDAYLKITGGTLTVDCQGDGLDSNGSLYIEGGTIYVAGPVNDGNGVMDYNGEGIITGGTLVATGMSGMAMNFGDGSTQGCMLLTGSSTTDSALTLTDAEGNTIVTFDPGKSYNSVLISSPDITEGGTYTLSAGSLRGTVEMTSLIVGQGSGMGAGGGMPQGGQPQQ